MVSVSERENSRRYPSRNASCHTEAQKNDFIPAEKERETELLVEIERGLWDSSEKAFNMITAGTDTGEERRRGGEGGRR